MALVNSCDKHCINSPAEKDFNVRGELGYFSCFWWMATRKTKNRTRAIHRAEFVSSKPDLTEVWATSGLKYKS